MPAEMRVSKRRELEECKNLNSCLVVLRLFLLVYIKSHGLNNKIIFTTGKTEEEILFSLRSVLSGITEPNICVRCASCEIA